MKKLISTNNISHDEWLKYRKKGIGGSDAGGICGLNPYVSPISIYQDKITDEVERIDNEAMRQGRELEEYVAKRFAEATGLKVRRANAIFYNEQYPFMLANVDRLIVGDSIGLECKTANTLQIDKWKDGNIPAHYLIQCYHYMAVTGAKAWYIAVVIYGKDFKYEKIERDEEIIKNLINIESDFWNNHVVPKKMPTPDGSKLSETVINQYYKNAVDKKVVLSGFNEKLKRREEVLNLLGKLDKEKKIIEQEIKLAMEDAEIAIEDEYVISWKNVCSSRVDVELLKEKYPNIYQQCLKQQETRRFSIKVA